MCQRLKIRIDSESRENGESDSWRSRTPRAGGVEAEPV
jgi:hypothetical protein